MYTHITCVGECKKTIKIVARKEELDALDFDAHEWVCPWCKDIMMRGQWFQSVDRELTPQEFLLAASGAGLPEEIVTQKEPVIAMLLAHRILDVRASEIENRCILDELVLDNGVTLHLGSSGFGAIVFKATRKEQEDASGSRTPTGRGEHGPGSGREASADDQGDCSKPGLCGECD